MDKGMYTSWLEHESPAMQKLDRELKERTKSGEITYDQADEIWERARLETEGKKKKKSKDPFSFFAWWQSKGRRYAGNPKVSRKELCAIAWEAGQQNKTGRH